jgi:hypothetical protein
MSYDDILMQSFPIPVELQVVTLHIFRNRVALMAGMLIVFALQAMPQSCPASSNISNFNGTPIQAGTVIWFNANFKASGIPSTGATISFKNSTIAFAADQPYMLAVPNAEIIFDPHATCASTTFDTANNTWRTTVPLSDDDEIFLTGLAFPVPAGFGRVQGPVTWQGTFTSATAGITVGWKWGAAVYTVFSSDYNAVAPKPGHQRSCLYNNSDHAGTPEGVDTASGKPFKSFVTGGARGGGGSNWTGSWSGTVGVTVCQGQSATFCLTIQKQFFDGSTISTDLLGWGMNVTDPSGVTTHYITDSTAGQTTVCQLNVGNYTVTEDPTGNAPPACAASPFQTFVNGVQQFTPGTAIFTWNSTDPVTVLFVNRLGCAG